MARTTFRGYNRVKFQSLKLSKTIFCQSLLLRDYLIHLEWDENVKSYVLKPFNITYKLQNVRKTFRPHLLVKTLNNQQIIIWLKYPNEDEKNLDCTLRLISNFCENKGFVLAVKTPVEIRQKPFFSNLKLLRRYQRCEITFHHTLLCREFFSKISNPTLGDLINFFTVKDASAETAFALLSQKIIEADIHSVTIDQSLPLTLKQQHPIFNQGRLA